jgi:hypothetical protein
MNKIVLILTASCITWFSHGQQIDQDLKHFTRVVASPRVHVILNKGDHESIRLVYHNVNRNKINIDVRGRTLRIYLDGARKVEPRKPREDQYASRESLYKGASVTAYVTYKALDMLEIRGEQELTCEDPIESEQFTLRAYGENEINLASLKTGYFKAKLYGENRLLIKKGRTIEQKYLLYGENIIDTRALQSDYISTSIFGEGSLKINSTEEVRINAVGEPSIQIDGGADVNRRLVIGKANIIHDR